MEKITSNSQKSHTPKQYTSLGLGQIAVGLIVIFISTLTTLLGVHLLGLLIAVWGCLELLQKALISSSKNFLGQSALGWLAIITGLFLFMIPGIGVAVLSLILAIIFIIGGFYKIFDAANKKMENWGLIMSGGGISILLGLFIFTQWPIYNTVLLGVLIGFEIILDGWSLIATSYTSRKIKMHRGLPV